MKLTHKTPEARSAYVDGYGAGVWAAINKIASMDDECAGGAGNSINPDTGVEYGRQYYDIANSLMRLLPSGRIVESFEMELKHP